jgi:cell division protein FtsQ
MGAIGGAAIAVGIVSWLYASGWLSDMASQLKNAAVAQTAAAGMIVDDVLLEGRVNTPRQAVLRAVDVRRGDPILNVDPTEVAERVAAISWVESVVVERRLPGTVYVKIVEREPMALWQLKGRVALIDRGGVVLTRRDLSKFDRLLTVVGSDAPRHTPALLNMIAGNPPLARRVRAAVRVGGRRWNLRFDNGIDVSLPQRGAAIAWARLGRLERSHGLLARDIKAIDLRLPDRLIVRKKTDPATHEARQGKKT